MKHVIVFILSTGVSFLVIGMVYNSIPQTAFVDNQRLFEAFEGKKELEQRLEQASNQKKMHLDSIGLQIQVLQAQGSKEEATLKRLYGMQRQYDQLSQVHQQEYQQKGQEYTEVIWKQISQYTIEYGKTNGYDYIFGIAGQGTLMYGKEQYDVTEEVLTYINSKYAGN